jgi:cell wall-active antibiotic response 4TMS protein YvqF
MRTRYRSFFWPLVLIVVGLIALLVELNVISADRLYRLADLWPLILIVIGLEIIARRALHGVAVDVATALILLIAAGGAVAYVAVGPAIPGGTQTFDASDPIGNLSAASLQVDVGAVNLTVHGNSSLGGDLYRAHIEYSGPKPTVTLDKSTGVLRISQDGGFAIFGNRRFLVDLQINPAATWSIRVASGAATDTFDLTTLKVSSIELRSGASREDLTLGPPKGIVPITVDGGAVTVRVHRPSGTAVSAHVSGGAVNLTADGHHEGGVGNLSWQSDGFAGATDAYRIEVSGGACTVTVDASSPAA